jgi:hypothetical protein
MKKVVFLLLFLGFCDTKAQSVFNPDSVNYHFMILLNKYRQAHNLHGLYINKNLKNYADNHATYLVEHKNQSIVHSFEPLANNDMKVFRNMLDKLFGTQSFFVENVAHSAVYEKGSFSDVNYPIEECRQNYLKMIKNGPSNKIVAESVFLMWKYSPAHNKVLLHKSIKGFYLAFKNHQSDYYYEFVGLN